MTRELKTLFVALAIIVAIVCALSVLSSPPREEYSVEALSQFAKDVKVLPIDDQLYAFWVFGEYVNPEVSTWDDTSEVWVSIDSEQTCFESECRLQLGAISEIYRLCLQQKTDDENRLCSYSQTYEVELPDGGNQSF